MSINPKASGLSPLERIPTTAEQTLAAAAARGTISEPIRRWPSGLVLVQAEVDGQVTRIRIHESRLEAARQRGQA